MRQVLPPIEVLAPFVRHIMVGGFDSERVHLPACADVQLLVYLTGGAFLIDPAGTETALPQVFLAGAVSHPRRYRVAPGSRFVAATFRPGGLLACLGIPASRVTGKIIAFTENDTINHVPKAGQQAAATLLQTALADCMQKCVPATLPPLDPDSLNRPVAILASEMGLSVRQFERHCLACLGMPLRQYRRLARYSAAMAALMMEGAAPKALASLALEAGYVDQSHFTRDFCVMVGQSPGRFMRQRGQDQYRLWQFTPAELESYLT